MAPPIGVFTLLAFFLLYHSGEQSLSFEKAPSFENTFKIFTIFQKLFDRDLHFLYTIC